MSAYILSTMTNAVCYRVYRTIGEANPSKGPRIVAPVVAEDIIIRGGANRPSVKSGFGEMAENLDGNPIWTARGVVTTVTDEQSERLKSHWLFQKHLDGGFVEVLNKDISHDHKAVAKIAANMNGEDPHQQLSKATVAQRIKVKTPSKELAQEW